MEEIKKIIQESIDVKRQVINSEIPNLLSSMSADILKALKSGGKLMICGNGGSAADAQHIAAELSVRFKKERKGIPALALATNFSHLTAAGNDYGYDAIFSRQVEGIGRPGDYLIGISTSGNSPNIINAIKTAQEMGIHTIAWTGASGGKLSGMVDAILRIPSEDTARIQECHILCGHIMCELIEKDW